MTASADRDAGRYDRVAGAGRVVATLLGVGLLLAWARPAAPALAAGLGLVAAGEVLRVWAAGHLHKTVELITAGPYRFTRNPLYLGRLAIFTGLCVMATLPHALNWIALGAGWLLFFGYYLPRKERVEPARLRGVHGPAYERYFAAVPALFPSLRGYPEARRDSWSLRRMVRNREHWMVLGLILVAAWLWLRRSG